jgi:hypothetical protein
MPYDSEAFLFINLSKAKYNASKGENLCEVFLFFCEGIRECRRLEFESQNPREKWS